LLGVAGLGIGLDQQDPIGHSVIIGRFRADPERT
jgi:hypothetical protein